MSTEYSVEEVREALSVLRIHNERREGIERTNGARALTILTAYADLLEQIERAREGVSDAEIMAEWFKADGSVHGPNVETVTMPQAKYLAFRRSVAHLLPSGERGGVDGNWDIVQETIAYLRGCPLAPGLREIRDVADNLANAMHQAVACPPAQAVQADGALNEQSGNSGQFDKGVLEGLSIAKSECDSRIYALDGGGNQFRREATASQCSAAIQGVYVRRYRAAYPGSSAAQPRAVPDGLKELADEVEACWICASNGEGEITLETINNWSGRLAMLAAATQPGESA